MRIVSLLPAATDMVVALRRSDQLVGVSHECDGFPSEASPAIVTRPRIDTSATGGQIDAAVRDMLASGQSLFELDEERIAQLRPDVILTQGLCPVCAIDPAQVDALAARLPGECRVIPFSPMTLDDALADLALLGQHLGAAQVADQLLRSLDARLRAVTTRAARRTDRRRLLILEWLDPFFSAGHWNPQLIELAGAEPVLASAGQHYRQISFDQIAAADPRMILIACCGFSLSRGRAEWERVSHLPWNELSAVRDGQVHIADGTTLFNRPGPRLIDSLEFVAELLDRVAAPADVAVNANGALSASF